MRTQGSESRRRRPSAGFARRRLPVAAREGGEDGAPAAARVPARAASRETTRGVGVYFSRKDKSP